MDKFIVARRAENLLVVAARAGVSAVAADAKQRAAARAERQARVAEEARAAYAKAVAC